MRALASRMLPVALGLLVHATLAATETDAVCDGSALLGPPVPFQTGPNAHYMATGDFNEDSIPDLAVTNGDLSAGSLNSSLAILLGTGDRTYAAPVLYLVGRSPRGVVARDFNEDGILDLAIANKSTDDVSILIGRGTAGVGDGTFAPAVQYPAGAGPFEIVAEDLDRDGIIDLATCLNSTSAVVMLPGLGSAGIGNGTFGAPIGIPLSHQSTGIATGDLNRDGIPDLVATQNFGGTVAMLLGTGLASLGTGSFSLPTQINAGPQPFHVEVADLDEDGDGDLVVANTGGGGIAIRLGLGNGSFLGPTIVSSGNSSTVAVGDVNLDGILDLITGTVTGGNTGLVEVFLGQGSGGMGNGTFGSVSTYDPAGDVYQVIVRDLDQDGSLDVLTAQGYGNFIELFSGICTAPPPDLRPPVLTDVRDVPNDNGGRVFLTWTSSSLDVPGGAVNSYRVWRRIPPAIASEAFLDRMAAAEVIAIPQAGRLNEIIYWEALVTLPAQRLVGYGYTAATAQDSLPHSNPYTAFFITALTSDFDAFYSSDVDSGYSVDNIRPRRPGGLAGQPLASGFALHWPPNDDLDLVGYRLYRGATAGFVPSAASLIAAPTDTGPLRPVG